MSKNIKSFAAIAALVILALILVSCEAVLPEEPSPEEIETAAAETQAAIQTETAVAELEQEATDIALTQTAIAEPTDTPEPEPTPTDTPEPDPTPVEPDVRENWAAFVADITVEDSTVFDPGESFLKIWRLRNRGTSTWTTSYQAVFTDGYRMSAPSAIELPETVAPGETFDLGLEMVAPTTPGQYTGYWMLMSDTGEIFGVGADGNSPFWVRIRVTEEDEVIVYNFAENCGLAGWESSVVDPIVCPSAEDIENGFVQEVDSPRMENNVVYNQPSLLTYPDFGESGYMVGRYPPILIEEGDHFRATIGCQFEATDCFVNFTLRVLEPGVGFTTLGMWLNEYDGSVFPIDVDLSDFAGQEVEITLSAIAADDTYDNYAIWIYPRLVRIVD